MMQLLLPIYGDKILYLYIKKYIDIDVYIIFSLQGNFEDNSEAQFKKGRLTKDLDGTEENFTQKIIDLNDSELIRDLESECEEILEIIFYVYFFLYTHQ